MLVTPTGHILTAAVPSMKGFKRKHQEREPQEYSRNIKTLAGIFVLDSYHILGLPLKPFYVRFFIYLVSPPNPPGKPNPRLQIPIACSFNPVSIVILGCLFHLILHDSPYIPYESLEHPHMLIVTKTYLRPL